MTYKEIQSEVIKKYRVDLCDGTKCEDDWSRMHAHPKQRRVCKWKPTNSAEATFALFHEIGHIETHTGKMRRCESEYAATVWAIERMCEYGIVDKISDKQKRLYQDYILRERDRGVRRGGANYPTTQQLMLKWESKKDDEPMTFKELRTESGMTQQKFADYFGIPKRTIEDWERGIAKCAPYLLELMKYKLDNENKG